MTFVNLISLTVKSVTSKFVFFYNLLLILVVFGQNVSSSVRKMRKVTVRTYRIFTYHEYLRVYVYVCMYVSWQPVRHQLGTARQSPETIKIRLKILPACFSHQRRQNSVCGEPTIICYFLSLHLQPPTHRPQSASIYSSSPLIRESSNKNVNLAKRGRERLWMRPLECLEINVPSISSQSVSPARRCLLFKRRQQKTPAGGTSSNPSARGRRPRHT